MSAALGGCGLDAAGHGQPPGSWTDDGSVDSPVAAGDGSGSSSGGDASVDHSTPPDARADAPGADVAGDDVAADVVAEVVDETPTGCSPPCTGQACVNGTCQGVCAPGSVQVVPCGNCGQETDTCGSDGNWVQGTCTGQGVCRTGDVQCGGGGANQPQICNAMCKWANNGPACMATNPCMTGRCVCGTGTCPGCCAIDNTCQAGTMNNACGVAGVTCVDCTQSAQHCTGAGFCN